MTTAPPLSPPDSPAQRPGHGDLPETKPGDRARDHRANSFDLIRLLAATWVLIAHSAPLRGHEEATFFGYDNVSKIAVYVFFAISGYLITQSWVADPSPFRFSMRRALRVFPGLICVVVLSVFVLGPVVTTLPLGKYFATRGTWGYLRNIALSVRYPLPGVFTNNVGETSVNGSLWTLPLEVMMYGGVLVLGRLRLRNWWTARLVAGGLAAGALLLGPTHPRYGLCDLGVYFWLGAVLYLARDRLPLSWPVAAGLVLAAALCVYRPLFHVLAWVAIPYLVLLVSLRRLPGAGLTRKFGDFSYGIYIYAFPVQQVVVWRGGAQLSNAQNLIRVLFFTFMLAAASWHCIESPALKLKPRRAREPVTPPTGETARLAPPRG